MPAGHELLGRSVLELVTDSSKLRHGIAAARQESLSQIGDIRKALGDIGRSMSETGSRMTVGITAPVIALGSAVLNIGKDFDTVLNRAVGLAGVSRDAIGGIRKEIVDLGTEVGKTPQELAEAFYFVASAGFEANEAMEVLRTSAIASAAGLGKTQDVAKVLGLTINSYGRENITAARAADILAAAVEEGTAEADAFASVLGRVVPTAATLGVSFEQVTASLAAMTVAGLSADEAATSLNQVLVSVLKPTKEAETALEGMGLSAEGLRKQLREQGLLATLRTLEERFAGNDEAASQVFGNVRALRGVLALLGLDSEQLNAIFKSTEESLGNLANGYEETEGPAREMARAEAALHAQLIALAEDVMPVVIEAVKGLVSVVRDAVAWFKGLPQPVRETVVQAALLAAAIGPVLVVLGALVSTLGALVGVVKVVALTWIPTLVTGLAKVVLTLGFFVASGGVVQGITAIGLGLKSMALYAVAASGPLALLTAAVGALLFVWNDLRGKIAEQSAQISEDVQGTLSRGVEEEMQASVRAIETGLNEIKALPGLGEFLASDAVEQLERDKAALEAALTAIVNARQAANARHEALGAEFDERWNRDWTGASDVVRNFQASVALSLDESLAKQRQFISDVLAELRGFRTALEESYSTAREAELDLMNTQLRIAQLHAELAALEKETSTQIKNGTTVQSLEYRTRKANILVELSELNLHMGLILGGIHSVTALESAATAADMEAGLTSTLPEVKAAYEGLRLDILTELRRIYLEGGPAGDAAAKAIARLFDPKNANSPFHGMTSFGDATIDAWVAGMISSLMTADDRIRPYVKDVTKGFATSSPPPPGAYLHGIDTWGLHTGAAWIDGIIAAIRLGVGRLAFSLSSIRDPFRAMVLPQLALAAAAPGFAQTGNVERAIDGLDPVASRGRGGDTFQTTLIMPGPPTRDPFEAMDRGSRLQRFGILNRDPRKPRTGRFDTT